MSQVWFITGANRGIGAQVAQAALRAGHRVVATGRKLDQLRATYPGNDNVLLAELDVTRPEQAETAVQAALARFGRIDVLVNNAGYGLLGNFEEIDAQAIEAQFATNVFGLMHVTRAVLPAMRRQRSGHIFNLSSVGGALGFEGAAVYCATKYAVEGLSASLSPELAPFGIHVTVVEPGFFRTDFLDGSSIHYGSKVIDDYGTGTVKAQYDAYSHRQPGDPAKLGAALVQLAGMSTPPKQFVAGSDALGMITGALEGRLDEIRAFATLTASLDGDA